MKNSSKEKRKTSRTSKEKPLIDQPNEANQCESLSPFLLPFNANPEKRKK